MPIIVPFLRLGLLGLNVYQTFKVLKLPPMSSRTGQVSAKYMVQRKRNMKGCMAVWLVWCCYTVFERIFDGILGIFLPFYNELKAVSLLFLIITRARGAEPIFLHVLRPAIKPYVSTLDWALDTAHTLGDFALLVLSVPLSLVREQWRTLRDFLMSQWYRGANIGANSQPQSHLRQPTPKRPSDEQIPRPPMPTPPKSVPFSSQANGPLSMPVPTIPISLQPRVSSTHKIWYPPEIMQNGGGPPRALEVNAPNGALHVHPFADSGVSLHEQAGSPELAEGDSNGSSDWGRYPPFPSAYPITPAASHDMPLPAYPPVRPRVVSTGDLRNPQTAPSGIPRPAKPIMSHTAPGIVSGRPRTTDLSGPHHRHRDEVRWETDELGFGVSLERRRESPEDSDLRSGSGDDQSDTNPSPQLIDDATILVVPEKEIPMLVDDDEEDYTSHNPMKAGVEGSTKSKSSLSQVEKRRPDSRSSQRQTTNLRVPPNTSNRFSTISRATSRSSALSTESGVTSLQTPATESAELPASSESGYSRSSSIEESVPAPPLIGRKRSNSRPAAGDSKKSRLVPSVKPQVRPALAAKTSKGAPRTAAGIATSTIQPKASNLKEKPPLPIRSSKRKRDIIDPLISTSSETLTRTTEDDDSSITTKVDAEDRNATLKAPRRNPTARKHVISLLDSDSDDEDSGAVVVAKQPRIRGTLTTRRS